MSERKTERNPRWQYPLFALLAIAVIVMLKIGFTPPPMISTQAEQVQTVEPA